jgi:hypothetical protein
MGVEKPSHYCTEFEQCIWTVHTVTPLSWVRTVYKNWTHRHIIALSLNSVCGLYTPSHHCTEFEQYIWTEHTVIQLHWVWKVSVDWTHRHRVALTLKSVCGLYTPSHHCTEFEQCIWTEHSVIQLHWIWKVSVDWTHRHTVALSFKSVYGLYTLSRSCTEFEQCIWTVHTVTQLHWDWTVYMDCKHCHTVALSLNSVYGIYTPSHSCTEFEQFIWNVHTVTQLHWIWTVYMECTHRHTIVRLYYCFRSAYTIPYSVLDRIMNCHSVKCTCRCTLFWICGILVGYLSCITDARARVCCCVYSAYTLTLHFPCWLSIVKDIRSLPYLQTKSPSYDKNHSTLNGQIAATNVLSQWLMKKFHAGILVHNNHSNWHHAALSLLYRYVIMQTTHSNYNETPRYIQSANTHTHTSLHHEN